MLLGYFHCVKTEIIYFPSQGKLFCFKHWIWSCLTLTPFKKVLHGFIFSFKNLKVTSNFPFKISQGRYKDLSWKPINYFNLSLHSGSGKYNVVHQVKLIKMLQKIVVHYRLMLDSVFCGPNSLRTGSWRGWKKFNECSELTSKKKRIQQVKQVGQGGGTCKTFY